MIAPPASLQKRLCYGSRKGLAGRLLASGHQAAACKLHLQRKCDALLLIQPM
jgi:hypothetical protein